MPSTFEASVTLRVTRWAPTPISGRPLLEPVGLLPDQLDLASDYRSALEQADCPSSAGLAVWPERLRLGLEA